MGLSAFNAMRAREKARAEAEKKTSTQVEVKVQEVAPAETSENREPEKKAYNFQKKKTDAEKLKKKD